MPHTIETCYGSKTHCYIHNEDESIPANGAFQVCFECNHVFLTETDLLSDFNQEVAALNTANPDRPPIFPATSAEDIHFCPHCMHDF